MQHISFTHCNHAMIVIDCKSIGRLVFYQQTPIGLRQRIQESRNDVNNFLRVLSLSLCSPLSLLPPSLSPLTPSSLACTRTHIRAFANICMSTGMRGRGRWERQKRKERESLASAGLRCQQVLFLPREKAKVLSCPYRAYSQGPPCLFPASSVSQPPSLVASQPPASRRSDESPPAASFAAPRRRR